MAFEKFFKQQNTSEKKPKQGASKKKEDVGTEQPQQAVSFVSNSLQGIASTLKHPHVTEKAVDLTAQNQYVFQVYADATKKQVQEAIQRLYNVTVERVHMVTIPAKQVRFRGRKGAKKGYKKAIVKVKEGQKIDVLPT